MSDERTNQLTLELAKCRQQNRQILDEREGFVRELSGLREQSRSREVEVKRLTERLDDAASLRSLKDLADESELLREENDRLFKEGKQLQQERGEAEKRFSRLEHRLHESENEKGALLANISELNVADEGMKEEMKRSQEYRDTVQKHSRKLEEMFEWRGVLKLSGQRLLGLRRSGVMTDHQARDLVLLLLDRGVECADETLFELMRLQILSEDEVEAYFRRGSGTGGDNAAAGGKP